MPICVSVHNFMRCSVMADGVMTAEWSTSNEWVLVTGGCDGAIRFWDIRRAGCFLVLNQSSTQLGRRPPVLKRSMITKVFFFFGVQLRFYYNSVNPFSSNIDALMVVFSIFKAENYTQHCNIWLKLQQIFSMLVSCEI